MSRVRKYTKDLAGLDFWKMYWVYNKGNVVYISGKISGLDYQEVVIKFDRVAKNLEKRGYAVINPVDFVAPSCGWETAMKLCISALPYANYIWMLPDWERSEGARIEKDLAEKMKIKVINAQIG